MKVLICRGHCSGSRAVRSIMYGSQAKDCYIRSNLKVCNTVRGANRRASIGTYLSFDLEGVRRRGRLRGQADGVALVNAASDLEICLLSESPRLRPTTLVARHERSRSWHKNRGAALTTYYPTFAPAVKHIGAGCLAQKSSSGPKKWVLHSTQ